MERKADDELIVRCPGSRETWYMTCGVDNKWIGDIFNCSSSQSYVFVMQSYFAVAYNFRFPLNFLQMRDFLLRQSVISYQPFASVSMHELTVLYTEGRWINVIRFTKLLATKRLTSIVVYLVRFLL